MPNRAHSLLMTSSACVAFDDDETEGEAATAGGAAGGGTSSGISCESDAGFCGTVLDQDFAGSRDTTIVMGEVLYAAAGTASARRATGAVAPIVSDTSASTAMSDADCRRGWATPRRTGSRMASIRPPNPLRRAIANT